MLKRTYVQNVSLECLRRSPLHHLFEPYLCADISRSQQYLKQIYMMSSTQMANEITGNCYDVIV